MAEHLTIPGPAGEFEAFVAWPAKSPAPAVVVLHEVFGVNADIRETCAEIAREGFIAVAPALFWRQESDVDLGVRSEADWKHGLELYQAYDRDAGVEDIRATLKATAALPECNGKVAVLGYCLGGLMAFLASARSAVDATVVYHGGEIDAYLDEVGGLRAPLLMHLAEEDEFIPKAAQVGIQAALADVSGAKVFSYPGQNHAFSRHGGGHYDEAAAALARRRTLAFLNGVLLA